MDVGGVVLTHGAGGDRDHHTLVALADGLAPCPVERINFPYRDEGRRFPDRAPKLVAFLNETVPRIADRWGVAAESLILGGRSMGGRICSMAVAEGLPAAGLLLLSYPLHPPAKPENLRVAHFGAINVPCLFISGDRDRFGTPAEFAAHLPAIPAPVTTHWLENQGHDPRNRDPEIIAATTRWVNES